MALDCRYRGQSHELTVDAGRGWLERFHAEHQRRNGYVRREEAVEVIALRATAQRPPVVDLDELPSVSVEGRSAEPVLGPEVLVEPDCTVWIPPGWEATAGTAGALVLRRCAR